MRRNLRIAVALMNGNSVTGRTVARSTMSAGLMLSAAAARWFGLNLPLLGTRGSARNCSGGLGSIATGKQCGVAIEATFSAMALLAAASDGR
jgi:hypothetical protein